MRVLMLGACASLLAAAAMAQPYDQNPQTYRDSDQGYGDQQQYPDNNTPPDQYNQSTPNYQGDQTDTDQRDENPGGPHAGDRGENSRGGYDRYRGDQSDQYDRDEGDQYRDNGAGQYDNGQYDNGQYDSGQYGGGQYGSGQYGDDARRGYSSDSGYRNDRDDDNGQSYGRSEGYRMSGAHYTGRVGDQSWRDSEGRTCIYRQLTWTGENGQPAYKWVPSCHD